MEAPRRPTPGPRPRPRQPEELRARSYLHARAAAAPRKPGNDTQGEPGRVHTIRATAAATFGERRTVDVDDEALLGGPGLVRGDHGDLLRTVELGIWRPRDRAVA